MGDGGHRRQRTHLCAAVAAAASAGERQRRRRQRRRRRRQQRTPVGAHQPAPNATQRQLYPPLSAARPARHSGAGRCPGAPARAPQESVRGPPRRRPTRRSAAGRPRHPPRRPRRRRRRRRRRQRRRSLDDGPPGAGRHCRRGSAASLVGNAAPPPRASSMQTPQTGSSAWPVPARMAGSAAATASSRSRTSPRHEPSMVSVEPSSAASPEAAAVSGTVEDAGRRGAHVPAAVRADEPRRPGVVPAAALAIVVGGTAAIATTPTTTTVRRTATAAARSPAAALTRRTRERRRGDVRTQREGPKGTAQRYRRNVQQVRGEADRGATTKHPLESEHAERAPVGRSKSHPVDDRVSRHGEGPPVVGVEEGEEGVGVGFEEGNRVAGRSGRGRGRRSLRERAEKKRGRPKGRVNEGRGEERLRGRWRKKKENIRRGKRQKREEKVDDSGCPGRRRGTQRSTRLRARAGRKRYRFCTTASDGACRPPLAERGAADGPRPPRGRTSRVDRVPIVHAPVHLNGTMCWCWCAGKHGLLTSVDEGEQQKTFLGSGRMPRPYSGTRQLHHGASTSSPEAGVPPAVAREGKEASTVRAQGRPPPPLDGVGRPPMAGNHIGS